MRFTKKYHFLIHTQGIRRGYGGVIQVLPTLTDLFVFMLITPNTPVVSLQSCSDTLTSAGSAWFTGKQRFEFQKAEATDMEAI